MIIFLALVCTFHTSTLLSSIDALNHREKIFTLQYKEIKENYDAKKGKSVVNSYVTYVYPNLLRIDTNGKTKTVEIYKEKGYIYYDKNSKVIKTCSFKENKLPTAIEKGKYLDKVMKERDYEFFGYEEKDNKEMIVIGVLQETDGHAILNKYWIEDIDGNTLPYKEECFVDNLVVSQTTYIYLKINKEIDNKVFDIDPKV